MMIIEECYVIQEAFGQGLWSEFRSSYGGILYANVFDDYPEKNDIKKACKVAPCKIVKYYQDAEI